MRTLQTLEPKTKEQVDELKAALWALVRMLYPLQILYEEFVEFLPFSGYQGFFFSSLLNVTIELSISSLFPTIPSSRASSLQYAPLPPWSFSPCSYTSFGCVVVYILNNLPPPASPPLQVAGFHRIV